MRHCRALARLSLLAALACAGCRGSRASAEAPSVASYDVGARPRSIAVSDLNGDGHRDVVVANSSDGTLTLLLGVGDGRLRPSPAPIPAGNQPSDVDAIDLDQDGDDDLVVANHETSGITVLINDGQAHFTPAPGSPFDSGARPHVHGVATGDFDGDGWVDVAVESADTKDVVIFAGGPGGLGAAPPVRVAVGTMPYHRLGAADVTRDGIADILVPGHGDNTVRVVQGGRDGGAAGFVLADATIRLASKPWMVLGADVNADRRNDLVVVQTDAVSVWLGGPARFSEAPGSPFRVPGATQVATGDLDGDGTPEIAVGPWDGDEVTILAGRTLTMRKVLACERPLAVAIADLDGDGKGELLAASSTENRLVVTKWGR